MGSRRLEGVKGRELKLEGASGQVDVRSCY